MLPRPVLACLLVLAAAPACRRERPVDAVKLCALSEAAARTGDDAALLDELTRELGVPRKELRRHADGVFAPTGHFLLEEWGIFVTRPGVVLPQSKDPSFVRRDVCLYDYRIGD